MLRSLTASARTALAPAALISAIALVTACSSSKSAGIAAELGLHQGLSAKTVLTGLNNPCGLTFREDGALTVCAAGPGAGPGNGRVIVVEAGKPTDYITGFATEYWKVGADGAPDRFKLGPLSALWLDDGRLAVSNGGLKDGQDNILFFESAGSASQGIPSNGLRKTSTDEADNGEGNLVGISAAPGGDRLYVCGQGADAKSWLLSCHSGNLRLSTFASADENGISVNSPMVSLPWDGGTVLVLYSGAGGQEDGLVVQWDARTRKPLAQWTLPGVFDPMGMARIPGTDELAVVDNNWSLTEVREGGLFRVALTEGGGEAGVTALGTKLKGPTSCAFGPDGRLYVALLGPMFDSSLGSVISVGGIR